MVNVLKWDSEDDRILQRFQGLDCPVILVVNKVDKIADKALLLAYLQELSAKMNFAAIIPLSAKTGDNVANLTDLLTEYLPQSPHCYPPDCVSDRSERFLAAEIIREKIIRSLGQEVPFCTTVAIDSLQTTAKLIRLSATIWVERDGQKAIVIGKGGLRLKMIGKTARLELEKIFHQKVFLELWVKVKSGWSDDERALISLGYHDH